jgi:hypothetical protein
MHCATLTPPQPARQRLGPCGPATGSCVTQMEFLGLTTRLQLDLPQRINTVIVAHFQKPYAYRCASRTEGPAIRMHSPS